MDDSDKSRCWGMVMHESPLTVWDRVGFTDVTKNNYYITYMVLHVLHVYFLQGVYYNIICYNPGVKVTLTKIPFLLLIIILA